MTLQRLVITFGRDSEIRVLYRRKDGPNPGTVRRRREVEQLAREGLTTALEALDAGDDVADLGTSGFTTREDTLGLYPLQREDTRNGEASPFLPETSTNCLKKGGR